MKVRLPYYRNAAYLDYLSAIDVLERVGKNWQVHIDLYCGHSYGSGVFRKMKKHLIYDGLVKEKNDPKRKYQKKLYFLTPKGREILALGKLYFSLMQLQTILGLQYMSIIHKGVFNEDQKLL